MAKLLWRSMTPWLRRDVHAVTHAKETFHRSPFIAIHVRRGDKIRQNSSLWQDTEVRTTVVAGQYLIHVIVRTRHENQYVIHASCRQAAGGIVWQKETYEYTYKKAEPPVVFIPLRVLRFFSGVLGRGGEIPRGSTWSSSSGQNKRHMGGFG